MKSWQRHISLGVLVLLVLPTAAHAQLENNVSFYDANNAQGYLLPLNEALGAALSSGLYYSANIPDKFFIRLEGQAFIVNFSDSDRTFSPTNQFSNDPNPIPSAPTAVGDLQGPTYNGIPYPGGLNLSALYLGAPQLRIGGFKGTEALIRWLAVDIGDSDLGKIDMFGLTARHSISQYLTDFPLALSGMISYQSLGVGDDFLDSSLFSIGVQGSKRFSVLEPYAGLAVDSFSMTVKYDSEVDGPTEIDFDSWTTIHASLGVSATIAILRLNAGVDLGKKTVFNIGIGIGN